MKKVRTLLDANEICFGEALLMAIMALSTIESALGNLKSYRLHLSALKLLQQEKGHLKLSSGQTIAEIIAMYSDTVSALSTGTSAFGRRPYEAIYPCQPSSLDVPLPSGFAALLQQVSISQDTVAILANACRFGLGVPCVTLTYAQKITLTRRRQTFRRYHNYLDSVPIILMPDSPDILFEKMLVLALSLFAWCGFSTIRSPQFGVYHAMNTQLSGRLVRFQPDTEIERQCAVWMWLMGLDAWRIGGSNGTILSPGLDMLRQFHRRFPEYRSWAEVQRLTRLFFWTGGMETFWSQRWDLLAGDN